MIITNIIENNDGTATIEFDITENEKTIVKNHYGQKRFTKKLFQKFVIEGLANYINKNDN